VLHALPRWPAEDQTTLLGGAVEAAVRFDPGCDCTRRRHDLFKTELAAHVELLDLPREGLRPLAEALRTPAPPPG
jgi:hypothetical protein